MSMTMEFDEIHEVEEPKSLRLSLHLIVKRHLPPDASKWSHEKILQGLNEITHLRLDRENIGYIDNLELLGGSITNVYLQHNRIEKLEGLDTLHNLSFLTLANNRIQKIGGLVQLKRLGFLDLSNNLIPDFDIDELPQSLIILNLIDNPCTKVPDYRGRIIQDLPKLRQLDQQEVSREERREAGYVVSSDSECSSEDDEKDQEDMQRNTGLAADGDLFKVASTDILLRSQVRLENMLEDHKHTLEVLDDMRDQHNIPPSARSTARSTATSGSRAKSTSSRTTDQKLLSQN